LAEGGDGFEAAVFAPAGDVGNGLAGDVEAKSAQHDQRRGVDDDFGLGAPIALVVDAEGVDRLVDEGARRALAEPSASTTIPLALVSHQPPALPAIASNDTV
jgi:hypothetical protein